jgi:serine/threonine-protein kinase
MSPEQCLGTKEIDHRSDIYSLGAILFEALCGHPPFFSEGIGALVNMHLNVAPPSVRSFVPALPERLDAIILCALAKKPILRRWLCRVARTLPEAGNVSDAMADTSVSQPSVVPTPVNAAGARPPARPPSPTTFSSTNGETTAPTLRLAGRRRVMTVAALVVTAAVGIWGFKAGPRVVTPMPPQPLPAPAAVARVSEPVRSQLVRLRLESIPAGARVIRAMDGIAVGTTPWTLEVAAKDGETFDVRVEKDGYVAESRSLSTARDQSDVITLQPQPPEPQRRRRPPRSPSDQEPAKL